MKNKPKRRRRGRLIRFSVEGSCLVGGEHKNKKTFAGSAAATGTAVVASAPASAAAAAAVPAIPAASAVVAAAAAAAFPT